MSEIRRLRMLLELKRLGTISAVARSLSFSTSVVSQQLTQLERDLGARLLQPDGRRVRLTPQGEALIAHAEGILREWEEARTALAAVGNEISGSVALAAFESALLTLIPDIVKRLHAEHPAARLSVVQADADVTRDLVTARTIDIGMVERFPEQTFPRDDEIIETVLFRDHMLLAVPAGSGGPGVGVRDFADHDWVIELPGTPTRDWSMALCRREGFEPRIVFESSDMLTHHHLVKSGVAVGFLPALLPSHLITGVDLIDLGPGEARTVSALTRRSQHGMPLIGAILGMLRP